jgi:hypothetical protein
VWSYGPRTLTRVSDRRYEFGSEVVFHDGTAWEFYYQHQGEPKNLIERIVGNQPWPWLVPWEDFTARKLCYPDYDGGTIYNTGDRVSLGGYDWVAARYSPAGYGPYGGFLNGESDGAIYWVRADGTPPPPPPPSGITVASTSVVMNLTRYGSSGTTPLVKKSTEGEYLGNSSGSGDTFYLRSGFVYKKLNTLYGVDYGEIYLLPPNSIISGSPTSDDYVSPSPFWRIIQWTSNDGTSGSWFGYNSSTSTTTIPTTGWTPDPLYPDNTDSPNGVTAISISEAPSGIPIAGVSQLTFSGGINNFYGQLYKYSETDYNGDVSPQNDYYHEVQITFFSGVWTVRERYTFDGNVLGERNSTASGVAGYIPTSGWTNADFSITPS